MKQNRDFGGEQTVKCITPAVRTADVNGASIDRKDHDGALFIAAVGASGDTLSGSVYLEIELEHCDDNSTWVDCDNSDLSSSVTGNNTGTAAKIDAADEDDLVYTVAYMGIKRYVRPVLNVTGTHSSGIPVSVVCQQNRARYPV